MNSDVVVPNRPLAATTWSPPLRSAIAVMAIAAIPDEVATHSLPPSSAAEAALERAHGRVREPGVDVSGLLLREPGRGLPGAREHEARREEDRVVVFLLTGPGLSGTHRQRVESEPAGIELVHSGRLHGSPDRRPKQKTRFSVSFGGFAFALAVFIERPQAEASNRR